MDVTLRIERALGHGSRSDKFPDQVFSYALFVQWRPVILHSPELWLSRFYIASASAAVTVCLLHLKILKRTGKSLAEALSHIRNPGAAYDMIYRRGFFIGGGGSDPAMVVKGKARTEYLSQRALLTHLRGPTLVKRRKGNQLCQNPRFLGDPLWFKVWEAHPCSPALDIVMVTLCL